MTGSQMRLQDGEYNKKEKNPNVVELDLVMMEWSLEPVGGSGTGEEDISGGD